MFVLKHTPSKLCTLSQSGNVRIDDLDALEEEEEEEDEFDTFESEDDFFSRETILSYDERFQSLRPTRGKLSKDITLSFFSPDATGIGKATLTKIWRLAGIISSFMIVRLGSLVSSIHISFTNFCID